MPICLNCKKQFPARIKVNGKELLAHKRQYCIECNPFGSRNFWRGKRVDKSLTKKFICKTCGNVNKYKSKNNECSNCRNKKIRENNKNKAIVHLGCKCFICGYDKCKRALTFHHKNPDEKEFTLSGNWIKNWENIKKELDKCVLLCNRCHEEVHDGITNLAL